VYRFGFGLDCVDRFGFGLDFFSGFFVGIGLRLLAATPPSASYDGLRIDGLDRLGGFVDDRLGLELDGLLR
jgi:hypothetical protein